jgi:hypothetical protein
VIVHDSLGIKKRHNHRLGPGGVDLCLHRPRDPLLKPLLGLLLSLRCVHGYCGLVHGYDLVQDGLSLPPHQINESLKGPHSLHHQIIGQACRDPSGRLLYQAQVFMEDPARCPNRGPMA